MHSARLILWTDIVIRTKDNTAWLRNENLMLVRQTHILIYIRQGKVAWCRCCRCLMLVSVDSACHMSTGECFCAVRPMAKC